MTSTEQRPLWLVLLPQAPFPVTLANLRSAYGQILTACLQKAALSTKSESGTQVLDIAVYYPGIVDDDSRGKQYQNLQQLICQLYRLLCTICTEQKLDTDNGNEVDTRILLFTTDEEHTGVQVEVTPTTSATSHPGLWPDLQLLASCQRQWEFIIVYETEEGTAILDSFLQSRNDEGQEVPERLNIGKLQPIVLSEGLEQSTRQGTRGYRDSRARHFSVAVGGTFDHLHAGHKLLLTMTALVLEPYTPSESNRKRTLTVGITGDQLLKKKEFVNEMQDWDQRQQIVGKFLSSFLMLDSPSRAPLTTSRATSPDTGARTVRDEFKSGLVINYVEIFDPFGPTITDEEISALVVSAETQSGGKAVNDRRSEKGWVALEVFEVDVLNAGEDQDTDGQRSVEREFQNKISSTAIRQKLHLRQSRGT